MKIEPCDLAATFAVLAPQGNAIPVAVTPSLYEELDGRFDDFKGHTLVSCHTFDSAWPTWEMHPAGDEVVCLLAGEASFVFDRDGRKETVRLHEPGTCVIVPKATWHTARVAKAARMLFITPGEGTQNRPV